MLDFDLNENCYGCGACINICPKTAISFVKSSEGSYIPKIDDELCIKCGQCDRVCIYLHSSKHKSVVGAKGCYAAYQLDENTRMKSASGGMFLPIALEVIKNGGYVCGCVWNQNMKAVHIVSNNVSDIKRMCNSKYVQSDIGDCLRKIKQLVKQGKFVLFTGTPCQVAACKAVVGDSDNIVAISIICEGSPTAGVWEKYRLAKEEQYNSPIIDANFRSKTPIGWSLAYADIKTADNKVHRELSYQENLYVLALLQCLSYRRSCYVCKYKSDNGCADIIIGDLWKVDHVLLKKSKNKGISALLLNTEKGKLLFDKVTDEYYMEEYPVEAVKKNNPPLCKSSHINSNRDRFFKNLNTVPIEENLITNVYINKKKLLLNKILIRLNLYKFFRDVNHIVRDYRNRNVRKV